MESIDESFEMRALSKGSPIFTTDRDVNRWKIVDFGLIPKLLRLVLVNVSERFSGILTILISTAMSIADTVSDFIVAFTLIYSEHYYWALIVIIVDYLPSWDILAHNITSIKWREFKDKKEKRYCFVDK